MKNNWTYKVALSCFLLCSASSISAQDIASSVSDNVMVHEANKKLDNYLELKKLGFSDKEIYEDLGNANFLTKNYESALYWYAKLKQANNGNELSNSYQKRYDFALAKTGKKTTTNINEDTNWLAEVKSDYRENNDAIATSTVATRKLVKNNAVASLNKYDFESDLDNPIAISSNGNVAYFSKPIPTKPLYGVFSKKELVHKIYRAEKINGQWQNLREVSIGPKYASAKHPAVSPDGKRLFFASDMPGSYGKFDIYVSDIKSDGSLGVAKNLGDKVNSKKDDLYPNIMEGGTLFFASEGRNGYGGLDMYMSEVGKKHVGLAVNLGQPINSGNDDFGLALLSDNGSGYVMSNRGSDKRDMQKIAFTLADFKNEKTTELRDYNLLATLNEEDETDYTSSVFEDDK